MSAETFDRKQTNWIGLWYHPEYNGYSSPSINLKVLKDFKGSVRLYLRKNKLFEKGSNKPNYVISIKDSTSPTFDLDVYDDKFYENHDNIVDVLLSLDFDTFVYVMNKVSEKCEDAYIYCSGEEMFTRQECEKIKDGACMDGHHGYYPGDLLIEDYL